MNEPESQARRTRRNPPPIAARGAEGASGMRGERPLLRTPRLGRGVIQALRVALTLLVVGAFLAALVSRADAFEGYEWRVAPEYLALAALVALLRGAVIPYPWWRIVRAWGNAQSSQTSLTWGRAVRLYYHSGLARYVPGQLWFVPARAHLAEREGVRPAVTVAATAAETALLTGSALSVALVGGAAVPAWSQYAPYMLALGVGFSLALLFTPRPAERLVEWTLRRGGREPISARLPTGVTARVVAACWCNWLLYGLVALLSIVSLSGGEYLRHAPAVIGLFAASVLGGSLGLFVPQGLVVREGVLVYLLYALLGVPVPVGVGAAALTRLIAMGAEGVWVLSALRVKL